MALDIGCCGSCWTTDSAFADAVYNVFSAGSSAEGLAVLLHAVT
jgi:hypothetical protein